IGAGEVPHLFNVGFLGKKPLAELSWLHDRGIHAAQAKQLLGAQCARRRGAQAEETLPIHITHLSCSFIHVLHQEGCREVTSIYAPQADAAPAAMTIGGFNGLTLKVEALVRARSGTAST